MASQEASKRPRKRKASEKEGSMEAIIALFATAKKSFTCQICLKKFMSNHDIQRHFYKDHKERAKKIFPNFTDNDYLCYRCSPPKSWPDLAELKHHLTASHRLPAVPRSVPFQPLFSDRSMVFPNWYTQCHPCKLSFVDRSSLMEHVRLQHFKIVSFNCDECQMAFSSRQEMDEHTFVRHNSFVEEEDVCSTNPPPIQAFRLDGNKIIPIDTVGNSLSSVIYKEDMHGHDDHLPDQKAYRYTTATHRAMDLTHHSQIQVQQQYLEQEETAAVLFKCPLCPHMEPSEDQLANHIRRFHVIAKPSQKFQPNKPQQEMNSSVHYNHVCSTCSLAFISAQEYLKHMALFHPPTQEQLQPAMVNQYATFQEQQVSYMKCDSCNVLLTSVDNFILHQKNVHGVNATQVIEQRSDGSTVQIIQLDNGNCNEYPSQDGKVNLSQQAASPMVPQQQLRQPQNQIDPMQNPLPSNSEAHHLCSMCEFNTNQMQLLVTHMRKEHNVVARLKCPLCNNTYLDQRSLKRHYLKNHPTGPPMN